MSAAPRPGSGAAARPGPLSLAAARCAIAARELSALELLERCLERLPDAQQAGAFVALDENGARRAAARLGRRPRGALHGVPCAVKDLVDVAGLPTGMGRSGGRVATVDAPLVARLRQAGAVIVGKTRADELGLGTLTPGARDPRDPARSVGGSSGGSAIAVAVGAALLAVATDTAGSARIPAAACGVAGLCASAAKLPREGIVALAPSCDRAGLIAAGAPDLALAWRALTGEDAAWSGPVLTLAPAALGHVDADRAAAAVAAARRLGDPVVVLPGPSLAAFGAPRAVVVTAEAAARHRAVDAETPIARRELELGAAYDDAALASARRRLSELGDALRAAIGHGVLVTPTLPAPPPRWDEVEELDAQLRAIGRLTRLCGPVNSAGLVAASIPFGADVAGRPLAVQLVAAREATVLGAALRLEPADAESSPTA